MYSNANLIRYYIAKKPEKNTTNVIVRTLLYQQGIELYQINSRYLLLGLTKASWFPILKGQGAYMKTYRKELFFNISKRRGLVNITDQVQQAIQDSKVQEGLVLVNAMHITASVFINDDESGLHHDYEVWLEKLAPEKPYSQYKHNGYEDNADAHLKRTIMGREVVCAITDGKLDFGPWEQIFYYELDGKRQKRALVKIIGE